MKKRNIPVKNYFIVLVISILTLVALFLSCNYYKNYQKYQDETNSPISTLSEIKGDELNNYLVENHNIMLYLSNNYDNELEKEFVKKLEKKEYISDVVYINTSELDQNFYDNLTNYFEENVTFNKENHTLLIVKNGKIVKVLNINKDTVKNIDKNIEKDFYNE